MKAEEFESFDGLGLAGLVRRGDVSPAELLDLAVSRVEARNPELNAVVTRLYDQARAAIAAGLPDGPFTGVPYLLKDLGAHYAGAVTSFGSALFKDFVVDHDSEITARLRRAGLVIFGKTNTPELGLTASTEPRLFGPTRNPWKLTSGGIERRVGGRCRGRMVPMAHATDGGGSIRSSPRRASASPTWRNLMGPTPRGLGRRLGRPRRHTDGAGQRGPARCDVRARYRRPLLGAGLARPFLEESAIWTPAHRHHDQTERRAGDPGVRRGAWRPGGCASDWPYVE
jgi:hypothetical protein